MDLLRTLCSILVSVRAAYHKINGTSIRMFAVSGIQLNLEHGSDCYGICLLLRFIVSVVMFFF